ncbi:MAG TPA: deaminase [Candidatus Baltobacteraceae bacterium]|nr:deaminase [Candidatus Baltobacteraceae bacterium]
MAYRGRTTSRRKAIPKAARRVGRAGRAAQKPNAQVEDSSRRELVFGVVVPLGVDKDIIEKSLRKALSLANYKLTRIKISEWLEQFSESASEIAEATVIERKRLLMDAGDHVRERWSEFTNSTRGDAAALAAIAAIQKERDKTNRKNKINLVGDEHYATVPLDSRAYFIDSLKHPDELERLRRVYGPAFISIGVYAPIISRLASLELDAVSDSERAMIPDLMRRDENADESLGQKVGDAFFATDYIIDATDDPTDVLKNLERLVHLIFGDAFLTPSRNELGMFLARAAQVRSGSMARQIGAAILRSDGSAVSVGTNEVAKPMIGGQYWPPDDSLYSGRDMVYKNSDGKIRDTSDAFRELMVRDILDRLAKAGALTNELANIDSSKRVEKLFYDADGPLRKAKVRENIDYVRAVHAEASALLDCARHGVAVQGTTMYTTTFPCHECAKHIVDAGISEVVYLEPYPKSGTSLLYRDSVSVDPPGKEKGIRVPFRTFVGVAPPRYLEFFSIASNRRKDSRGNKLSFDIRTESPSLPYYTPTAKAATTAESLELKPFSDFTEMFILQGKET